MRALSPGDHALRRALWLGAPLGEAAAAAVAVDPDIDLTGGLEDLLDERILVGFAVSTRCEGGPP